MHRSASRHAVVALATLATLAALAAAPRPARAVAPGSASARRAIAATLAGDAHEHGSGRGVRRRCPDPLPETSGGRLALSVEKGLARWGESARRWATERAALALYVADVTGLSDLATRLARTSA